MPKRKQPSTLKDLCLKNIAENLERHALLYFRTISEVSLLPTSNKTSLEDFCVKNVARNLETHTLSDLRTKSEVSLYEPFQRHFSNKLLNILLEKKSDKYYHLQVLFDEAYKGDEMCMRCLEFIFNSKLTKVCLPHPNEYEKQRFNLHPELLIKLLYNCQKIAVLDLQRISIEDELFIPLIKHSLKNVVHINIAYTNCGDETVSAIWRHCPHLKYLKMPKNGITDEGMKMICGNYFNAKTNGSQFFGYCKNPIECSVKPKLKYLNINGNDITNVGVIWILQHIQSLKVILYHYLKLRVHEVVRLSHNLILLGPFDGESFDDCSVPQALLFFEEEMKASSTELNLRKLYFTPEGDVGKIMKNAISLCPKLKKVTIEVHDYRSIFFFAQNYLHLNSLTLCISHDSILGNAEFQNFLSLRGHQIKSFEFCGLEETTVSSIFNIMRFCPELEKLKFEILHILIQTDNTNSFSGGSSEKINPFNLMKLKTLVFRSVTGSKYTLGHLLSSIIKVSKNLQNLEIVNTFVNEEILSSFEINRALYNVTKLTLKRCNLTHLWLWGIIKARNELKTVKIRKCPYIKSLQLIEMENFVKEYNLDLDIIFT